MKKTTMKKLRILIFNWRDPQDPLSGGAERVTLKHAQYWVKVGHQVTWVSGVFPGAKAEQVKDDIRYLRIGSSKTLFLRAWHIYRTRLRSDVDVIIDEVHGLPMFAPWWAGEVKVIAFIHEVAREIWFEMFPMPIAVVGRLMEAYLFPWVYRKTQFWVDCESTQADLHRLGIPKKNVEVIQCAIDPIPRVANLKKKTQLSCVFVARLVKMKGIELALETFVQVLRAESSAKLWIVGNGEAEYVDRLKQMCRQKNINHAVKFWGGVTEEKKFQLMKRAHFLLHTSIREGFGLTVLEANSQKTPAAVFNVPALRDLVKAERGIIVSFPDTQALAQKIVRLYRDKSTYRRIQSNAYTFSQRFRWSTFTKQSERLLHL
jgi:glycosyltransferase involved in cell wall biosynthesis